jgi:hypothetical protein
VRGEVAVKLALFLTTELGPARVLLDRVLDRHPDEVPSVFVRDEHRAPLAGDLEHCDVRRDKPAGGKVAFVRALRRERFDRLIVAWHGGERPQPLRLVALFAGARQVIAVDEFGRERVVVWWQPWTWGLHALRRASEVKAATVARWLAACYRATVGFVLAAVALSLFACTHRRPWAPRRGPAGS